MASDPRVVSARSSFLSSITIAGLAALLFLGGCGESAKDPAKDAAKGQAPMALPVTVVQVKAQRVPVVTEAVGQTEGAREVEVRARVSGIVQKRLYQEGESVRAGTVLFQIDRAPFEIALDQAKAALAQETARVEQAQREAARMKQLAAERAVSQKDYDDSTSTLKQSQAAITAAQAKVREAELNLSYVTVTAPISGVTGRAQRSEGSLVTAGTDSALLTTISQIDPIWVRFSFSEFEYTRLRNAAKKSQVKMILSDGTPFATPGRVNFAGSTVDARLGTVQLRAEFANPGVGVLPGQFVRIQVLTGEEEAFLVPQSAVAQSDQGLSVWIVGADGKAANRPVEGAAWSGNNWVVRKGLAEGDQVIVDNLMKLRPGAPVQPHAPGAAPAGPPATAPPPDGKAAPAPKKAG